MSPQNATVLTDLSSQKNNTENMLHTNTLILIIYNAFVYLISDIVLLLSGLSVAAVSDTAVMPVGVQGTEFNLDILWIEKLRNIHILLPQYCLIVLMERKDTVRQRTELCP